MHLKHFPSKGWRIDLRFTQFSRDTLKAFLPVFGLVLPSAITLSKELLVEFPIKVQEKQTW